MCHDADDLGRVLYLETLAAGGTEGPSLVPYYRRHGFRVVGEADGELVRRAVALVNRAEYKRAKPRRAYE